MIWKMTLISHLVYSKVLVTPYEKDQRASGPSASGPPASGYQSRRAKYRSQKNDNIELQKNAILNKVADRISNREDKGEYSFGKQVWE